MNSFVSKILEMLSAIGVDVPRDEHINAEIDNAAHDHSRVVIELSEAVVKRSRSNGMLRESIRIAKERTNSLADFELRKIRHREQHRD